MNMETVRQWAKAHLDAANVHIAFSSDMPQGYETAYGTYDPLLETLFLNLQLVENGEAHEVAFYLFHELRHAMQYAHPEQLDRQIRESLPYVILYDGTCFKLSGGKWLQCHLNGAQEDFLRAYQNLPYEVDANMYAYEQAVAKFPACRRELQALLDFWLPRESFSAEEYAALFIRIDRDAQ